MDLFNPQHLDRSASVRQPDGTGQEWETILPSPFHEPLRSEDAGPNFLPLKGIILIVLAIFTWRLLALQVAVGAEYQLLSKDNSIRTERLPAERGLIFDASGKIVARNTTRSALNIRIERLPEALLSRNALYDELNRIVELVPATRAEIEELRGSVTGEFLLSNTLSQEQVLLAKELALRQPAVSVTDRPVREYTPVPGLAHLLGYVGQVNEKDVERGYGTLDQIGKTGAEATYESELRGQFGVIEVEVNASNEVERVLSGSNSREPIAGRNLRLSVDSQLQSDIYAAVKAAALKRDSEFGFTAELGAAVVAMEAKTGKILALVSYPAYDNNIFSRGVTGNQLAELYNDPQRPFFNRVTAGLYPPGSTIKPLVAAGALTYGVVSPTFALDTPPFIEVGGSRFPDWKDHGWTNITTAIAESNNIFFYAAGGGWQNITGLGLERLRQTLNWFGLEQTTGADIGQESSGFVLSEEWKRQKIGEPIYLGDVYHLSIGQGYIGVTPLQMAAATAAIANGGQLLTPQVAAAYSDSDGEPTDPIAPAKRSRLPVSDSTLQIIRDGLRQAVTSGSSRPLANLPVPVAGKTGTAQYGNAGRTHAWFTGYGPANDPEVVITVLLEGGGGSFEAAVPLAETVFRLIFADELEGY